MKNQLGHGGPKAGSLGAQSGSLDRGRLRGAGAAGLGDCSQDARELRRDLRELCLNLISKGILLGFQSTESRLQGINACLDRPCRRGLSLRWAQGGSRGLSINRCSAAWALPWSRRPAILGTRGGRWLQGKEYLTGTTRREQGKLQQGRILTKSQDPGQDAIPSKRAEGYARDSNSLENSRER